MFAVEPAVTEVTEPFVTAKSAATGTLLSASLKVTVNVSAWLVTAAVMLSVVAIVGAAASTVKLCE